MKASVRGRRSFALIVSAALMTAALPFVATSPSGALPSSPTLTCAGVFAGDIQTPDSPLPAATYTSSAPVVKGGDKIINTVNNGAAKGTRFSANLTLAASPGLDALLAGTDVGTGTLKVTWKNGAVKPSKPGDQANPADVTPEYKAPTVEVSENNPSLIPFKKLVVAKGTAVGVPASGTSSMSNLPPSQIVRTLGTGPVSGDDIVYGTFSLAYKASYLSSQHAMFTIWPYDAAPLTGQPAFVAAANAALAFVVPGWVDVDPLTDDDASCSLVGLVYVVCTTDPSIIPGIEAVCPTIV